MALSTPANLILNLTTEADVTEIMEFTTPVSLTMDFTTEAPDTMALVTEVDPEDV